ncbi:MAG: CocE/NonD family hydrolase [Rhizobiales bacterium]|nr:CocE/NonD family hydrolase [Hyphomicrobiales bacterium]
MSQSAGLPGDVEVVEHVNIEMPDGTRLSARLWLPQTAWSQPVPAVFEYIPYRKRDMVRARDERNHPWLAARGLACLRVDMRGSGDSAGLMDDMYAPAELADARNVIEWIAAQPWCNGSVGMFGTSWGGTASLQASIDAPDALKAVIAVCATHDRYEDDIHHMGGCLLTDSIEWGTTLPAILASPPDSATFGAGWREEWQRRLDELAFPLETWVREEARGAYWRFGSVRFDCERISCPVLAVGGWSDRYSNSVMSLVQARPDLAWGVVGAWGHHYPDQGHPGPAIGFQELMLEWWRHWLDPQPKQVLDWPKLRCWLCEYDPPADVVDTRRGAWIESGPPSEETHPVTWCLAPQGLVPAPSSGDCRIGRTGTSRAASTAWQVPFDLRVGQAAGDTGYFGRHGGQPLDQADDDARSLSFETEPLGEDVVLYGKAQVELTLSSHEPIAQLSIRLVDVAPDATAGRVAFSMLNLALDDNLDEPASPPARQERRVTVVFHSKAHRFRKGQRIRLSIAASYWPMVWPAPRPSDVHIHHGRLALPRLSSPARPLGRVLPAPSDLPVQRSYVAESAPAIERYAAEGADGRLVQGWHQPLSSLRFAETGTTFCYETRAEHRIDPADPLSAESRFTHRLVFERPDGVVDVRCSVGMTADATRFHLEGDLEALWNGKVVARRAWSPKVARRLS